MKSTKHKIVVGLMVVALLSGCAAKETKVDATNAKTERAVTVDATITKVEGTAAGTTAGVATRVGAKAVGGKKIKRIVRYSRGLAEALSGTGGYLLGSTITERKEKYANEEDRLNGEIKIFNQLNEKLYTYNTATVKEIANLQKQISEIERKKKATQEQVVFSVKSKESFAKKAALDKATTAKLASELSELNGYFRSIQGTGDPSRVAALRQEIETLQKHTAQFESNNKQMDQIVAAMPVRN